LGLCVFLALLLLAQALWPVLYMIPLFGVFLLPFLVVFFAIVFIGLQNDSQRVRDFCANPKRLAVPVFLFVYIAASWIAAYNNFFEGPKRYLAKKVVAEIEEYYIRHGRLPDENAKFQSFIYPGMQLKYYPNLENNSFRVIFPLHPMQETYYVSEDKNWYYGD
jgi:hypothetical protein